nr:NAD(P)-binding protein [Lachnospiraceae bacterium]
MGKTTGFLEYKRQDGPVIPEQDRIQNFLEFHERLPLAQQKEQAARCMDCGIPFCQAGILIAGMMSGCPLHNLVPEINDLVYRGRMEEAYHRLTVTHSFPEFTCRVCPALCEAACTLGCSDEPVSTKENEKAVIEYAYAHDLVKEEKPLNRTGKKVAVLGSGPAGLAAAQLLNRRGHSVTVYERADRVGGLLRYGIPNMKLDKSVIDRRVELMKEAGVTFITGTDVGKDVKASDI